MINFVTALPIEAQPIIRQNGLKQNHSAALRLYESEWIRLVVTGTGKVQSAIGVTRMLSADGPADGSILVNIGFAGTADRTKATGSVWIINQITDASTGHNFYPDMIYGHPFGESALTTVDRPVTATLDHNFGNSLFDMEASGCYQAGLKFLKTHQMLFFKIISDYGEGNRLKENDLSGWMESALTQVWDFIVKVHDHQKAMLQPLDFRYNPDIHVLKQNLKLTETQYHQLNEAVIACQIRRKQTIPLLSKYTQTVVCNQNERDRLLQKIIHELNQ